MAELVFGFASQSGVAALKRIFSGRRDGRDSCRWLEIVLCNKLDVAITPDIPNYYLKRGKIWDAHEIESMPPNDKHRIYLANQEWMPTGVKGAICYKFIIMEQEVKFAIAFENPIFGSIHVKGFFLQEGEDAKLAYKHFKRPKKPSGSEEKFQEIPGKTLVLQSISAPVAKVILAEVHESRVDSKNNLTNKINCEAVQNRESSNASLGSVTEKASGQDLRRDDQEIPRCVSVSGKNIEPNLTLESNIQKELITEKIQEDQEQSRNVEIPSSQRQIENDENLGQRGNSSPSTQSVEKSHIPLDKGNPR